MASRKRKQAKHPSKGGVRNYGTTRAPLYYLRFRRADGTRVDIPAKTESGARAKKRAEAEKILSSLRAIGPGELDQKLAQLRNRGKGVTISELRTKFAAAPCPTKKDPAAYKRDTSGLLLRAVKHFGEDRAVDSLTVPDLEAWRDEMITKGHSRSTIANRMHRLSTAIRWAIEQQPALVTRRDNPARSVRLPGAERTKKPRFTPQEARALLTWLAANRPDWPPIAQAALLTGARMGELRKLAWADVDLDGGRLTFRRTKNLDDRVVPIGGELVTILKAWLDRTKKWRGVLVFAERPTSADRPSTVPVQRTVWGRLKEAVIGAEVTLRPQLFHCLRRTYATTLLHGGAKLTQITGLLGHGDPVVTARYLGLDDEAELREAAEKLSYPAK